MVKLAAFRAVVLKLQHQDPRPPLRHAPQGPLLGAVDSLGLRWILNPHFWKLPGAAGLGIPL